MKKPKAPQLVTVAIFTTITIIFWVFLSLYRVLTSSPPPNVPPEILETISPSLDTAALENLPNKVFFKEGETSTLMTHSPAPTPAPITHPTIPPTIIEEGEISPSPTPTPSEQPI